MHSPESKEMPLCVCCIGIFIHMNSLKDIQGHIAEASAVHVLGEKSVLYQRQILSLLEYERCVIRDVFLNSFEKVI